MAAPSKNFTSIPDSSIDADSPLDTTLMTQIRDGLVHLEEWLGKNYIAGVDHRHNGSDSALTTIDVSVDDYLSHSNDIERFKTVATSGIYEKIKESLLRGEGTLRIKFEAYATTGSGGSYHAKIFRNGIEVGTEQILTSSYVEFSEDISGWSDGDLIQIYGRRVGGATILVQNLRLYGDVVFSAASHKDY
ncbi:MAG: hypothetical protein KAT46_07275 [Deltaproteobacteria bacterium]|nr:hypothetical protein [Deltaproteobacteria bacterium]